MEQLENKCDEVGDELRCLAILRTASRPHRRPSLLKRRDVCQKMVAITGSRSGDVAFRDTGYKVIVALRRTEYNTAV